MQVQKLIKQLGIEDRGGRTPTIESKEIRTRNRPKKMLTEKDPGTGEKVVSQVQKAIKQLGIEDSKTPKSESKEVKVLKRKVGVLEREMEKVNEEIHKLKQEHLSDVRLSFLLRPDSPNPETGYYTDDEQGSDIVEDDTGVYFVECDDDGVESVQDAGNKSQQITSGYDRGSKERVPRSLHQACLEGQLQVVEDLVSAGEIDINCRTKRGRTPVMAAACRGHKAVFDYLVRQGCDLRAIDEAGKNVFLYACEGGNIDVVKKLVKMGYSDCRVKTGLTPLMIAARRGHVAVFDYLRMIGCDLRSVSKSNNNILHIACKGGHVEMVEHILSLKVVDKESKGQSKWTPLMSAARYGHLKLFDILIREGCDQTATSEHNNNILHVACIGGQVEMVEHILSLDIVDKESQGQYSWTPLMFAARYGHKKLFDVLVRKGCDQTVFSEGNKNILHVACIGGHVDMVEHIISMNFIDKESQDQCYRTPLMIAAEFGHKEVFEYLVKNECDVTVVDENNTNILHVACVRDDVDMVQLILKLKLIDKDSKGHRKWTPLMIAAQCGHIKLFQLLVNKGCDQAGVDDDNNNILHIACKGGNVAMVEHILELEIIDKESKGQLNRTPLMFAARHGHMELFEFLVSIGCDVAAVDEDNHNILHVACMGGHVDMAEHILSKKIVNIEDKGQFNRTPLMYAARHGQINLFDFLHMTGCEVTAVDEDDNNILHLACMGSNVDMVDHILSKNLVDKESKGQFNRTPLMYAARYGHIKLFDFLVGQDCYVTVVDEYNNNIIHVASSNSHLDMVEHILLLDLVDKESKGQYDRTSLMFAAETGNVKLFDFLVTKGCDMTAVDQDNNTILHIACLGGNIHMVKYLLTMSDVKKMTERKNMYGETSAHLATRRGYNDITAHITASQDLQYLCTHL